MENKSDEIVEEVLDEAEIEKKRKHKEKVKKQDRIFWSGLILVLIIMLVSCANVRDNTPVYEWDYKNKNDFEGYMKFKERMNNK